MMVRGPKHHGTGDDLSPASRNMYHTTIVPIVLALYKVMQDFYHQQSGTVFGT